MARAPGKLPRAPQGVKGIVGWTAYIIEAMTKVKVAPPEILYVKRIGKLTLEVK